MSDDSAGKLTGLASPIHYSTESLVHLLSHSEQKVGWCPVMQNHIRCR
jgi:hypothetical protein